MRSFELPELRFSHWYRWEDRHTFPQKGYPGCYLLAITLKADLQSTVLDWHDVSYIGVTKSAGGLAARWRGLDRSIRGQRGHSGGRTIFAHLGHYGSWTERLYVGAMAVVCNVQDPSPDDYIRMGWVAFFEYEAFARYREVVGGHPRYNTL